MIEDNTGLKIELLNTVESAANSLVRRFKISDSDAVLFQIYFLNLIHDDYFFDTLNLYNLNNDEELSIILSYLAEGKLFNELLTKI